MSLEKEVDQVIDNLCEKHMRVINILKQKIEEMNENEARLIEELNAANAKINNAIIHLRGDAEANIHNPDFETTVIWAQHGINSFKITAHGSIAAKELAQVIKEFIETKGVTAAIDILNNHL